MDIFAKKRKSEDNDLHESLFSPTIKVFVSLKKGLFNLCDKDKGKHLSVKIASS